MDENVIRPIVLGELEAETSAFTYMCFAGQKTKLEIVSFYIEGPEENILVDTGTYAELAAKYWPGKGKDYATFEEGLDSVGLKPKEIDKVVYTHLHHDHCGYHSKLIQAEAWVQEDEWMFANAPHPTQAQYYPRELYRGWKLKLIKGDYDIADGVKVLHTPGHTPGTQSVAVKTSKGLAIIVGACTIWETFRTPKDILPADLAGVFGVWEVFPPTIATDICQAYDTNLRLKKLADILIPCHGGLSYPLRDKKTVP